MRRLALLVVAAAVSSSWSPIRTASAAEGRTRLIVLVVVDQMGAIYMTRYGDYLRSGLARLRRRGAYYPNGVHEQANTATGPGHASISTGTWPNIHGIVSNYWYDSEGARIPCVGAAERPDARFLMAPTIGEALKTATRGKSKLISIGIKDRAAILLAGPNADTIAYYDGSTGAFAHVQRGGKRIPAPSWLSELAVERTATQAMGTRWERLFPKLKYDAIAGPDDSEWEENIPGVGRRFPRTLGQGLDGPTAEYLDFGYPSTPHALDTVTELAKRAFTAEKLGQRGTVDLLTLGISGLDYAGHWWGPESQEALDHLLRIDRAIGELMNHFDAKLGGGRTLWVVTGDHGTAWTPERREAAGLTGRRVAKSALRDRVNAAFAGSKIKPMPSVLGVDAPLFYLDRTAERSEAQTLEIRRLAAHALAEDPAVTEAHAIDDLERMPQPFRELYARTLFRGRTPDVLFRTHPHFVVAGSHGEDTGTNHGSPYAYDALVPIFVLGPGASPGVDRRRYPVTRIAPTIAALVGIDPPASTLEQPLPAATR